MTEQNEAAPPSHDQLMSAYMQQLPSMVESAVKLCGFINHLARLAAAAKGQRPIFAIVHEPAGEGTRTTIRRHGKALGFETVDVRPGLRSYPDHQNTEEWTDIIGPFPATIVAIEIGNMWYGEGYEEDVLNVVRGTFTHTPKGQAVIIVAIVDCDSISIQKNLDTLAKEIGQNPAVIPVLVR